MIWKLAVMDCGPRRRRPPDLVGTFNQNGGTVTVTHQIIIGSDATNSAFYGWGWTRFGRTRHGHLQLQRRHAHRRRQHDRAVRCPRHGNVPRRGHGGTVRHVDQQRPRHRQRRHARFVALQPPSPTTSPTPRPTAGSPPTAASSCCPDPRHGGGHYIWGADQPGQQRRSSPSAGFRHRHSGGQPVRSSQRGGAQHRWPRFCGRGVGRNDRRL